MKLLKIIIALTLMCVSVPTNTFHQGNSTSGFVGDMVEQEKQKACVLEALVLESFGESIEGIVAVASVISNRVKAKGYPPDYCGVIKQPFQFSYRNSLKHEDKVSLARYQGAKLEKVREIADKTINGNLEKNVPEYVVHYAHKKVKNKWTKKKTVYATIGNHVFYY